MTTIRVARRERFVVIDQQTVRDRQLSLRARGLLVTLLSYPDHWRINSTELARHVKEGRDAIRAGLAELEAAGYLKRHKCQIPGGRWVTELTLYEKPGHTDDGFPGVGFPGVGFPGAIGKTVGNTDTRKNARSGLPAACGQCDEGWIFDAEDGPRGTVRRCDCNPPRARSAVKGRL